MKSKQLLESLGYSQSQINQIMMCEYDLTKIDCVYDTDVFRIFRMLFNDKKFDIHTLNELYDVFSTENDFELLKFIYDKVNKNDADDFIKLYAKFKKAIDLENLNKIVKTTSLSEKQNSLALISTITGKIQENIIDYPQKTLQRIYTKLQDDGKYPVDLFKNNWDEDKIRIVMELIDTDKEINISLFDLTNDEQLIKMMNFLIKNRKGDYGIVLNYNEEQKTTFNDMLKWQSNLFLEFYNSDLDINIIKAITRCLEHGLEYDFLLEYKDNLDAVEQLMPLYYEGVPKEDIEYAIKNFSEYSKDDFTAFNRLCSTLYQNLLMYTNVNFSNFFDTKYSSAQRLEIVKCLSQYNLDISKYCDERFVPTQMKIIAENLFHNKDVKKALNPDYTPKQMEEAIFYGSNNVEFDNVDEVNENYLEDKTKYYTDFANKYHRIFDGSHDDQYKMEIIDRCVDYNNTHAYQFDIDKCLKIAGYFNSWDLGLHNFDALLELGEKSEPLFEKELNKTDFSVMLEKILKETGQEIKPGYSWENDYFR